MYFSSQIGKLFASLILFVVLMLPTAIQFSHTLEGHEHITCEEASTHFHQDNSDCDICDFQMAFFNYDVAQYPNLSLKKLPQNIDENFSSFHSFTITNTQLRAPPIFLNKQITK